MKKILALVFTLCLLLSAFPASAEPTQTVEYKEKYNLQFSFDIPADWSYRIEDFSGSALGSLGLMPLNVFASNDDYSFKFEARTNEYTIGNSRDPISASFAQALKSMNASQYASGVTAYPVMFDGDLKLYVIGEVKEQNQIIASYFNMSDNNGYYLRIRAENENYDKKDMYVKLLNIMSSLTVLKESYHFGTGSNAYVIKDISATADLLVEASQTKTIVITGDTAKIRSEASISGGLIKTAYKGETFTMKGETGDFYIIDVNGRTGYVHKGVSAIR